LVIILIKGELEMTGRGLNAEGIKIILQMIADEVPEEQHAVREGQIRTEIVGLVTSDNNGVWKRPHNERLRKDLIEHGYESAARCLKGFNDSEKRLLEEVAAFAGKL